LYGLTYGQANVISVDGITDAALDPHGNLYLSTVDGSILKFDTHYQKMMTFASNDVSPITSLDVSFNFRIFGFYKNHQSYILLDRNFMTLNEIRLDPGLIENAVTASYSSDNMIWIFDETDFSLKKLNPTLNQLVINTRLPLLFDIETYSILQLEEYQNRIYLNNAGDGIYVFDQFGNFLKKLRISTYHIFNIFNERIFFIDTALIKSMRLYTHEEQIIHKITDVNRILTVLARNQLLLLIYPDRIIQMDIKEIED